MQAFKDERDFGEKEYKQEVRDALQEYEIDDTERWRGFKSMEPEEIFKTKEYKKFRDKENAIEKKKKELEAEKLKE